MNSDDLAVKARAVSDAALAMRADLDDRQPRTTEEEWMALDCIEGAAARLTSAAMWMARHEYKVTR